MKVLLEEPEKMVWSKLMRLIFVILLTTSVVLLMIRLMAAVPEC